MSINRVVTHLVSVALLLLWGGVLLYFYSSGRITHYLPPDGIFRPMALTAGIGLMVLGIFNLATMGHETSDCCDHDHDHDDDGHGHDHAHDDGCCGHDHSHDHAHQHTHSHDKAGCCDHGHAHAPSPEKTDCCGHDHSHGHDHGHSHAHTTAAAAPHDHAHGILEESGPIGRTVAILILAVPIVVAAALTPDQFSPNAIINKGLYSNNYSTSSVAPQTRLGSNKPGAGAPAGTPAAKTTTPTAAVPAPTPAPVAQPGKATLAEVPASGPRVPGSAAPATASVASTTVNVPPPGPGPDAKKTAEMAAKAPSGADATKSYGSFTLADLKAQVPQSKEGNFILEVPELYYTAGDKEVQGVLAGQMVETTAQVLPEKNDTTGKRLRIFRLLVQCCAADARPYSVPVEFADKAPVLKDMTWVKVIGKMAYKQEGGQTVPTIEVSSITETTSPDNAMLY